MMASVPVSKGQLLPAVAVSFAHVIVITSLPGGCCYIFPDGIEPEGAKEPLSEASHIVGFES